MFRAVAVWEAARRRALAASVNAGGDGVRGLAGAGVVPGLAGGGGVAGAVEEVAGFVPVMGYGSHGAVLLFNGCG